MTNMGKKVEARELVGHRAAPVNGFYDSDHAGVFSKLKLK